MRRKFCHILLFLILIIAFHSRVNAQTIYTQIWNEIDLVSIINDKWSAELDLAGSYSNTPSEDRVLKTLIQRNVLLWVHYQFNARWKFSSYLAYYYNKDVPEIGQYEAPEWRYAIQGRYYFHKTRYTLYTDMRPELRWIGDEEGNFDFVYRYHQKLKYIQPLNSQVLRKGVIFVYASDQIIFRSTAKENGLKHFDANLFTVGAGYLITNDFQVELAYVNLFVARDDGNIINNALSLTLTFNNLIRRIGKTIIGKPDQPVSEE